MDGSNEILTPDNFFRGPEMSGAYIKLRPDYPPELAQYIIDFLSKTPGPRNFLVDVGCGSGQSTLMMLSYFERLLGVDLSPDQIKCAKQSEFPDNVDFTVGSCGNIPVESGTVDLITAGTAIHWFDLDEFFPEVERVLRPGGCLAIYSYLETDIECDDAEKTQELKRILRKVEDDILENNRPDQWGVSWEVLKSRFKDLRLPFEESQRGTMFSIKKSTSVAKFVQLVKTYSESKEFMRRNSEFAKQTFDQLQKDLMSVVGNGKPPEDACITYILPVFTALARKPLA
ncbi:putative methyltransferase DDB_G0268948 [Saccoglossus kowalevskii]|uniref:Methyltransferase DDB_G0268948-like n=1 Tax=Saccoglossus kowalevskii TaxID=10224 RepID=A0ABM0GTW5_SACKO|nr:PREDICTED: putative methyltransferase DDB_G0268948-like [Saccoglossus kowalevskii]